MKVIEAIDIVKSYGEGARRRVVLRGIDVRIAPGEFVSVVGPSGVGKSTLLNLLGALDSPDSGYVRSNGTALGSLTARQLAEHRARNVSFVFQFHHLLPEFTARENVWLAGVVAGGRRDETEREADRLLERLGVSDRADARPSELSGGEAQRVAVARALVNRPPLVLADEPTGNLDSEAGSALVDLMLELRAESGTALVVATHNRALAERADRMICLRDGKVEG